MTEWWADWRITRLIARHTRPDAPNSGISAMVCLCIVWILIVMLWAGEGFAPKTTLGAIAGILCVMLTVLGWVTLSERNSYRKKHLSANAYQHLAEMSISELQMEIATLQQKQRELEKLLERQEQERQNFVDALKREIPADLLLPGYKPGNEYATLEREIKLRQKVLSIKERTTSVNLT